MKCSQNQKEKDMTTAVEQGFDFEKAEQRIKELQALKSSLSYENSMKKAENEDLLKQQKALISKVEELKANKKVIIDEMTAKVAENEKLLEETRLNRIAKQLEENDFKNQRRIFEADRNTLEAEKASFKELCELRESKLARAEDELKLKEVEVERMYKEAEARLTTLGEQEAELIKRQEQAHAKISESESLKKEADRIKLEAEKVLSDVTSQKTILDAEKKELNENNELLLRKYEVLRKEQDENEKKEKKLIETERDITLERNKLLSVKQKLNRDIESASIDASLKKELKKEIDNG